MPRRLGALDKDTIIGLGRDRRSASRPSDRSGGRPLPGQQSVSARGDDAEDPAGGREILGREIKEPGGDLLKNAADSVVPGPAYIGEGDGTVGCYQSRGGQLGDRRFDRRAVKFPGVRDSDDELATVDAGTAGCGDGEYQPLVERDAGSGQQRLQQGAEGALGLADDLGAERRVVGHDCSSEVGSAGLSAAQPRCSCASPRRFGQPVSTGICGQRASATLRLDILLADAQDELLAPPSPGERRDLVGMLTRLLDHHTG